MPQSDPDFRMSVRPSAEATEVILQGSITERTTLAIPEQLGRHVVVDGGGVERINSMGVRAWILFFERLTSLGLPVTVRRLSPALVLQASMISSFLGNSQVESFLAPYACPSCDHALDQEFGIGEPVPDALRCPKCAGEMEFDSEKDAYLAFRAE